MKTSETQCRTHNYPCWRMIYIAVEDVLIYLKSAKEKGNCEELLTKCVVQFSKLP